MSSVISAALVYLATWFQSRHAMQLEILALRHQLAVYQHGVKRPPLQLADRLFWAWLSWLWSGWQQGLEFVQPHTVIAWQKKRFRDYWRRLSQSSKPGRPAISKEVINLIRDMWCSNPTWGLPRIVGELRKLGITVATSAPCASILFRILPRLANASLTGDGCPSVTSGPATRARTGQKAA